MHNSYSSIPHRRVSFLSSLTSHCSTHRDADGDGSIDSNELREARRARLGEYLQTMDATDSMDLSSSDIGPEEASAISQKLASNSTVTYVNLDANELGDLLLEVLPPDGSTLGRTPLSHHSGGASHMPYRSRGHGNTANHRGFASRDWNALAAAAMGADAS